MIKSAALGLTVLIMNALQAQAPLSSSVISCEQGVSLDMVGTNDNQDQVATIARCYVQKADNLQASRWFEKIADLENCKPEYLRDYGQCLKSLKLYGKAKFYFQKFAQYDPTTGNQFVQSCDIAKMMLDGEPQYGVTPIGTNTAASEFAPVWRGDRLTYTSWPLSSAETTLRTWSEKDGSSTLISNPEGRQNISHIRYSVDGKSVVYATSPFSGNARLSPDMNGAQVFLAEVTSSGKWVNEHKLNLCDPGYAVGYPAFSGDGKTIYFSSNMPGGQGGWDIYRIKQEGDAWSVPVNLGNVVNTTGNEISPCASMENLYFSSDWHVGIGGYDVIAASISGSDFQNVRNVGFPVNSPKDDLDFVWDETAQRAVFASNRTGGSGAYDLYLGKPTFREVEISVMNRENMSPVSGALLTITPGTSMSYTNISGVGIVNQPISGERKVIVKKEGFKDHTLSLTSGKNAQKSIQVYLDPISESVSQPLVIQQPKSEEPVVRTVEPRNVMNSAPVVVTKEERIPQVKEMSSREMYFIQIAALARNASLDPYANLKTYGDLVVHDNGTYAKVRVGTFATESEAKLVLSRVKSSGYPDAFVVMQPVSESTTASTSSSHSSEYKVRLGTYSKIGNFNPDLVMHLGTIESYRKDDFTIMLLAGFSNLNAAQKARDTAATKGFTDAYVVMDNNGVLERVK